MRECSKSYIKLKNKLELDINCREDCLHNVLSIQEKKQENKDFILMKRKLSSAGSSEGVYDQGGVDEQVQLSSALELEQSTVSAEAGGFVLAPHLAQKLGMQPGEMLFRSMFYGTPQASHISNLAMQLLTEQEELVRRELGEGTSSAVQSSDGGYILALMASNEATIRALLDSIESPPPTVVPEVAVEDVGTVREQLPDASEESTRDPDAGFMLAPDLALSLGMQPGQVLHRSMFYGTPYAPYISNLAMQLLNEQEDLVRRELGDGIVSAVQSSGDGVILDLIESKAVTIQALLDSIEAPLPTIVPEVIIEGVDTAHRQAIISVPKSVVVEDAGTVHEQLPYILEQITRDSDGGFVLPPNLALLLGMQPGQELRRSMFYGAPQSNAILEIANQISAILENLLRRQELERVAALEGISVSCDDTAALIATNEELMLALMASIEAPAVAPSVLVVEELESELLAIERGRVEGGTKKRAEQEAEIEGKRVRTIRERERAERELEEELIRKSEEEQAKARAERIARADRIAKAEQEAEAARLLMEQEVKAEMERVRILMKQKIKAEKERVRILIEQENKAERERKKAEREVDRERKKAVREIHGERESEAKKIEEELAERKKWEELVGKSEEEQAKARAERVARAERIAKTKQEAKAARMRIEQEVREAKAKKIEEERVIKMRK